MQSQDQEVAICGSPSPHHKFAMFTSEVESSGVELKGKFVFETFQYDPYLIDVQTRANWVKRFWESTCNWGRNHNEKTVFERSFMIYLPPVLKTGMELVVLLHGTNQTIFDTELVCQITQAEGVKKRRYGWMELADKQNFVVVIPQSRGLVYRHRSYYGWQPGSEDTHYLLKILTKVTSPTYWREVKLGEFSISPKSISVVGFSNGGLLVSELYINYISRQASEWDQFSILIFINYMGGIEHDVSGRELLKFEEKAKETPIVIMSCKREENYGSCLRAHQLFSLHDCNVCFVEIDHHKHEFILEGVNSAYQFMRGARIAEQN